MQKQMSKTELQSRESIAPLFRIQTVPHLQRIADPRERASGTETLALRAARLLFSTLLLGAAAQASVVYDFSGTQALFGFAESFHYTAPNFIAGDTFIPASSFDRCSTGQNLPCLGAMFFGSGPDSSQHYPELYFEIRNPDNSVGAAYYYFPLGATFASYGTLSSLPGNQGTLTISAVPEPATELPFLIGALMIACVGVRMRAPESAASSPPSGAVQSNKQETSFLQVLREELSVKLNSTTAPIQTSVIDRVERPTQN